MFSLKRGAGTKVTDVNVKPREPVLFCGTAAKEITALRPDTLTFDQQVRCWVGLLERLRTCTHQKTCANQPASSGHVSTFVVWLCRWVTKLRRVQSA